MAAVTGLNTKGEKAGMGQPETGDFKCQALEIGPQHRGRDE